MAFTIGNGRFIQPTEWEKFRRDPYPYVAKRLYHARQRRLLRYTDTHNHIIRDVPTGDILIHSGDLTEKGTVEELEKAVQWLQSLPHPYKIVVAGNHELCLDVEYKNPYKDEDGNPQYANDISWGNIRYLCNTSTTIALPEKNRQIKIYGSPNTPQYGNFAFQYPQGSDVWKDAIPVDTDILVTHGPPRYHLDINAGCTSLRRQLWNIRPKLHVFGHIHVGHGKDLLLYDRFHKAYEDLCAGIGGVWKVTSMIWDLVIFMALSWLSLFERKNADTTLVNAAMVRGMKNEEINDVLIEYI